MERKSDWKWALALFTGLVLVALPQVANLALIDRDETRFSEASREMIQRGDYVVPYCNGVPRYQKPPMIYWCQVACYRVFGETELAARLPSVLAGAGVGVIVFLWMRSMGRGRGDGLQAAILTVLSCQMMQQGRVATADGLLVFFMTLTAWLGWELMGVERRWDERGGEAGGLWLALVGSLALGFLTKGPEAWLPCVPLLYFAKTWRWSVIAVAVSCVPVLCWAIPAYIETKGVYWSEEIGTHLIGHMATSMDLHGTTTLYGYLVLLPLYFALFFLSAFPWSFLVPVGLAALAWPWPGWGRFKTRLVADRFALYLIAQAAVIFVVFTLMITKLPHYTLPALPMLAMAFTDLWSRAGSRQLRWLPSGLTLTFAAVLFVVPFWLSGLSPAKSLARQASWALTSQTEFATVTYHEPSVTWEMRRYVKTFQIEIGPQQAIDFLRQPGPRALMLPTDDWKKLNTTDPGWLIFETTGLNTATFKKIDLTLVVKR